MTIDFGTDLLLRSGEDGIPDLDPAMPLTSGQGVLAQDLVSRFSSSPGSLFWAPEDGLDLRVWCNRRIDARALLELQTQATAQALRDERVDGAKVTVSFNSSTQTLRVAMALETAAGPFSLVLGVSSVTVTLLEASRG